MQAEEIVQRAEELKKAQLAQAGELVRRERALTDAQEQLEHHARALQQVVPARRVGYPQVG